MEEFSDKEDSLDEEILKLNSNLSHSSIVKLFVKLQKSIKLVRSCIKSGVPDVKKQLKEIRRKERVKNAYDSYIKMLKLPFASFTQRNFRYENSETQLKNLIMHQNSFISEAKTKMFTSSEKNFGFNSKDNNPLTSKILELYNPESKSFLVEKKEVGIFSLFYHEEDTIFRTKSSLAKEIESQLLRNKSSKALFKLIYKKKMNDEYIQTETKIMAKADKIYKKKIKETKSFREISKIVYNKNSFKEGDIVYVPPLALIEIKDTKNIKKTRFVACKDEKFEVSLTYRPITMNYNRLGYFK